MERPGTSWFKILDHTRKTQSIIGAAQGELAKMTESIEAMAAEDVTLAEDYSKLKEHLRFAARLAAEIGDKAVQKTGCENPYLM